MGVKIIKEFKNGQKLIITERSHIHGNILPFITEAVNKFNPNNNFIKETINFD